MCTKQPPKKKRKLTTTVQQEQAQEIEDNDGSLLSNELDYQIQTGLYALRNQDPLIYDRDHSFIKSVIDDNDDNDGNDGNDDSANDNEKKQSGNNKYPWVKQLDDPEEDKFLQQLIKLNIWIWKIQFFY